MKWKELINAPYPTYYQRWKAVVIPSVIIFLILYLLQPFGISRIEGSRLVVVFGSALISAGVLSLEACEEAVPVSRAYAKEVKRLIESSINR